MARSTLLLLSACAVAAVACGPPATNSVRDSDVSKEGHSDAGGAIAGLDTDSLRGTWSAGDPLPSPSFNRFFSVDGSSLVTVDAESGRERTEMGVPEGFAAGVSSFDGRAVALTAETSTEAAYRPTERSSTRIVVARPDERRYRVYDLGGNFEPEAFSTDESELFLIEYLDLDEPPRYRVRAMRLGTGRLSPVVGRLTKRAPSSMRGTGRVQAYSPNGDFLYTLYTKQPPNYAHQHPEDVHHKGRVHAFVHVLNLAEGWAHCVDLPMPFGMGEQPASMLSISPNGRRLYAGDGTRVAIVNTTNLQVVGVTRT